MLLAGSLLTPDGFVDGWADLEGGVVRAVGRGAPPRSPDARGVVAPAPVNAHTHLGDAALRGKMDPRLGLDTLVRFPGGLKHRLLAETPEPVLLAAMREACRDVAASGARLAVDFREGGVAGARALREAALGLRKAGPATRVAILGRVAAGGDLAELLAVADGVGIPAIDNLPPGEAARWAKAAHGAGKLVALHASEGAREPVEAVAALSPHHVVHFTHATPGDFEVLADAGARVVVCPRSNAALVRRLPDVAGMLAAGLPVALGTDNASMQTPDVREEARFLVAKGILREDEAIRALHLAFDDHPGVAEGAAGPWIVYAEGGNARAAALAGAIAARVG